MSDPDAASGQDVVRELLLALLGYPGELFVDGPAEGGGDCRDADGNAAADVDGDAWEEDGFRLADDWGPDQPAEREVRGGGKPLV